MSTPSTCPRCGSPIAQGTAFCPNCGAPLSPSTVAPQSIPPPGVPPTYPPGVPPAAPPAYPPPPKRAGAGSILAAAYETFTKDPFLYMGIYLAYAMVTSIITIVVTLIAFKVPLAALSPFAVPSTPDFVLILTFIGIALGVALLNAIIGAIVSGMVTFYAVHRYRGTPTSSNMALGEGMRRFLSIVGAQILVVLAGLGLLFVPVAVIIAGAFLGNFAVIGIGILLFIVVGVLAIYLLISWSLSTATIMMEGKGAFGSLSRSWELTRGHRLSIFASGLVVLLVGLVVSAILEAVFGLAGPYGTAVGTIVATAVTGSWIVIMTGVAYQLIVSEARPAAYPVPPPVAPFPPR